MGKHRDEIEGLDKELGLLKMDISLLSSKVSTRIGRGDDKELIELQKRLEKMKRNEKILSRKLEEKTSEFNELMDFYPNG